MTRGGMNAILRLLDRDPVRPVFTRGMKVSTIRSVCECQARLGADLDENKHVMRGWAAEARRRREEPAAAITIGAEKPRFDVGWLCPFCMRNTLRSFDASGLSWREAPNPEPPSEPTAAPAP